MWKRYTEVEVGIHKGHVSNTNGPGYTHTEGHVYATSQLDQYNRYKVVATGYDIDFDIEIKDDMKDAVIEIWNSDLLEKQDTYFTQTGEEPRQVMPVIVRSGYIGNHGPIFTGVTERITQEIDGADWKAVLEVEQQNLLESKGFSKNFVSGYNLQLMIEEVCDWVGMPIGNVQRLIESGSSAVIPQFRIRSDERIWDRLRDLAAEMEYTVYIAGGRLYFQSGQFAEEKATWTLNYKTGLLKKKPIVNPEEDDTELDLIVECLLRPDIALYTPVEVDSILYLVDSIRYRSSSDQHIMEMGLKVPAHI